MRHVRIILVGAVVLGSFALFDIACVGSSPEAASTTGDASANDTGTTITDDSGLAADAAPSLGCPLGCLPPAPTGWTGPSAVYDGPSSAKPAACPTQYTQKELEGFQGMEAGAAECACGAPSFAGAPSCSTAAVVYSAPGCSGFGTFEGSITPTTCATLGNNGYLKVPVGSLTPGTCAFNAPTTTLPDAGFATSDLSCGLPQNASCTGSTSCVATPVPDAPFTRLCIHESGDVACPSADYAKRFVTYTSLADSRSCTSCLATASGSCATSWGYGGSCEPTNSMAGGTCSASIVGVNAVVGAAMTPDLTCLSDGGAPDGSVAATGAVTFCCNK